ncbi:hypothetical protein PCANC_07742 [Puccinia coronata f. sp. avenae]|uniref:Tyr recombinase domain-containing protein n=1 Tax=Puccinia coronata f. sp. avenae TaxID=200324 RepID=A0A2N5VRD9_9BASI|nr:hypothetical protein PCANC_07742 [Puccinia coronata f. sp. avenae]
MLRASAKEDVEAPAKEKKGAITIPHLVYLAKTLAKGLKREKAILDLVLVLFWGMARLGELTYRECTGHPNTKREVTIQDVLFLQKADGTKRATILLREAKTAKPREVQKLWLKTQGNLLCPIEALKRRKIEVGNPEATLFGYQSKTGQRTNLTREAGKSYPPYPHTRNGATAQGLGGDQKGKGEILSTPNHNPEVLGGRIDRSPGHS